MSANSLVNKAMKKLLQKMNEPEFYETFNNMSIKELSIPGFNQKKIIANIPKSILITSIFKPGSLQFDALRFLYNHYKISGAYRNRKFDKYKDPQEVIADLNGENYNQMLIWLLSNENEDFKKTGCDFIHSDLFDQLIQEKSQQPDDADILPQPLALEQESLIHTADVLKKENETLKNKLKKMEVKNAALAKSLQATKDSAAEVNTKLKKAEARLSTLCDEHQRQAQEIALINQKYDSLMNDYEILYEKYDAEISSQKDVTETPVKASRIVVITNQRYEKAELPALVETCQQEQIDTIIEQWGLISAIYVSECCISDGNRRKLMKKKKTDDLTIRFLNESRIEEVIYGGKNDGFHKN